LPTKKRQKRKRIRGGYEEAREKKEKENNQNKKQHTEEGGKGGGEKTGKEHKSKRFRGGTFSPKNRRWGPSPKEKLKENAMARWFRSKLGTISDEKAAGKTEKTLVATRCKIRYVFQSKKRDHEGLENQSKKSRA